ncbi:MAG: endonuclease domain-containing protein [Candidatus Omnitrophica bacterium]|nr:endonuclease domain-containing protein [Candidatus Omnitrophota bacterium]
MGIIYNKTASKGHRRELRRKQTEVEKALWKRLRNKNFFGLKFFRQYSVGSYIIDFYCPACKLAIELDGGQHSENKGYDSVRTKYLNSLSIDVVRFWNNEVAQNMDGVLEQIRIKTTPPGLPFK